MIAGDFLFFLFLRGIFFGLKFENNTFLKGRALFYTIKKEQTKMDPPTKKALQKKALASQ